MSETPHRQTTPSLRPGQGVDLHQRHQPIWRPDHPISLEPTYMCESSQESSTASSIPTPSASGDETSTPEQGTPVVSEESSSAASSVPPVNQAPSSSPPTPVESQLGINDLFTVYSELVGVAHKWKKVGLALRLHPNLLRRIEAKKNDVEDNVSDVCEEWLKKSYDTESFGDPSWKLLVDAVAHPAGGKDVPLPWRLLPSTMCQLHNSRTNLTCTSILNIPVSSHIIIGWLSKPTHFSFLKLSYPMLSHWRMCVEQLRGHTLIDLLVLSRQKAHSLFLKFDFT
ncbi:hypothetical protein GBAR_LOCUS28198 [Geodia barretti]|uniref:Uncharacterized protein n=1 Tax=Geodia barretti TaxID=519541 RepID=A0AA35TPQ2_GEOBA|nr:hypothetical protein GBAR_LOCUS28198 [Geodia barretti]